MKIKFVALCLQLEELNSSMYPLLSISSEKFTDCNFW